MPTFIFLSWLIGLCLGLEVRQSPSDLITQPDGNLQIFCSHDKTDYRVLLWYQRSPGDTAMKLIGYLYNKKVTMEESYKNDFNISGDLGGNTAKKGSLIFKHLTQQHSAVYYCAAGQGAFNEAYFGKGTKLTVLEKGREVTPPTNESVKVFGPSSFECRNLKDDERKKTLLCVVSGFYPDHVSVFWQVNGKNETKGVATDNAAQWTDSSTEFYRITSRLRVPADDWNNPKNEFTCIISFFSGTDTTHYQNSIRGVEAQTKGVMTRDNYLRITQSAKLSYGVFIIKSTIYGAFVAFVVWKLQGSTGKQNH